jgi:hypothetical protein
MPPEPFFLGDYVLDDYGRRGRVYQIDTHAPDDPEWLAAQMHPFDEDELESGAPWYRWLSVLCEGGGAIQTTEKRVTRIDPFELDNDFERYHFAPAQRVGGSPIPAEVLAVGELRQMAGGAEQTYRVEVRFDYTGTKDAVDAHAHAVAGALGGEVTSIVDEAWEEV